MYSVNGSLMIAQLIGLCLIAGSLTACESDPRSRSCDIAFTNGSMLTNMPLAVTQVEQSQGLQHNANPAPGMAFSWQEPTTPAIWMKDTPAALDAAFIAPGGAIIHTAAMEPYSETLHFPPKPVIAVVEVPAGELDALGISIGSQVESTSCW